MLMFFAKVSVLHLRRLRKKEEALLIEKEYMRQPGIFSQYEIELFLFCFRRRESGEGNWPLTSSLIVIAFLLIFFSVMASIS